MAAANSGLLRRTYDYVALFALLHVIAAIGMGAYLIGSGAVTPEKVQRIAVVLRGDESSADDDESKPQKPKAMLASAEVDQNRNGDGTLMDGELLRLEAQRIKAELDQRLTMNHNIMLRVTTQRDEFKRAQQAATQTAQRSEQERQEEGFQKQLAIFEALSPKVAVEHLLNLESTDEAARVLLEMDTRKAKKIVESAKGGAELKRMQAILQRVRDVAPDRSGDFANEQATP